LVWLTLVVALVLGWLVREWQHSAEFDTVVRELSRLRIRANQWRKAAGALEEAVKGEGWQVIWEAESVSDLEIGRDVEDSVPVGAIIQRGIPSKPKIPSGVNP
jgi:hypothetical protein